MICRSIVNAHEELTVDKPAEAGAEFSFTLPAIAAAAAPAAQVARESGHRRSVGRQDDREPGPALRNVAGGDRPP